MTEAKPAQKFLSAGSENAAVRRARAGRRIVRDDNSYMSKKLINLILRRNIL